MGVAVLDSRPRGRLGSGLAGAAGKDDSAPKAGVAETALGEAMAERLVSMTDSRTAETVGFGLLVRTERSATMHGWNTNE